MKLNKWTVGLVAAGLVSLVNAEEKMVTTPLLTQLSSTTISGYVDTSAYWNPGSGNFNPAPFAYNAGKQDGFNLDSIMLSLSKPLEEGQWSSGYQMDLQMGPDAGVTSGDVHIRQAYVSLRAPVGNGLDVNVGRWDTILGYEAPDAYKNPNFTRSYGFTITPQEYTGVLAAYHVSDLLSIKAGVANTADTGAINARLGVESRKAYLAGLTLVAPDSAGFLKGSVLNVAAVHGPTAFSTQQATDVSVNASIATPLEGLRIGAAWDQLFDTGAAHTWVAGGYASFRPAPESKLSLHLRGEYYHGALAALPLSGAPGFGPFIPATGQSSVADAKAHIMALTGTIQYDLWQNVISRLEVRWDHSNRGRLFGNSNSDATFAPTKKNDVMVAANIIYKF